MGKDRQSVRKRSQPRLARPPFVLPEILGNGLAAQRRQRVLLHDEAAWGLASLFGWR